MKHRDSKNPESKRNHCLTTGWISDIGMKRSTNEDRCKVLAPYAPLGAEALLLVADGMGGHQAGDVASQMTVDGMAPQLGKSLTGKPLYDSPSIELLLKAAVQGVNASVWEEAKKIEYRGMGTTLTAAVIHGSDLIMANAGDSRGYLLRDGSLGRITRDHSWVEQQVEAGLLSHEEADRHPNRNIITRAIGIAETVEVDIFREELREGDVVVMCSDGLYSLVTDPEIANTVGEAGPSKACNALVKMANDRGGHDNITVVIARVGSIKDSRNSSQGPAKRSMVTTLPDKTVIKKAGTTRTLFKKTIRILSSPLRVLLGLTGWLVRSIFRKNSPGK